MEVRRKGHRGLSRLGVKKVLTGIPRRGHCGGGVGLSQIIARRSEKVSRPDDKFVMTAVDRSKGVCWRVGMRDMQRDSPAGLPEMASQGL